MSFKPLFAWKIVNGVMDCEVRTFFKPLSEDDVIVLYASSPVKAVLGEFRASRIFVGRYPEIVYYVRRECRMFDEDNWRFIEERYSSSRRRLIAFKVKDVVVYDRKVGLDELRAMKPGFRPPRSYDYIDGRFYHKIRRAGLARI